MYNRCWCFFVSNFSHLSNSKNEINFKKFLQIFGLKYFDTSETQNTNGRKEAKY